MNIMTVKGQQIKIGDFCPNVDLKRIINSSVSNASITDFKGKLVILDFWGTGCLACIQSFQKIDSLQKKFAGKIQFIAVNRESEDSTIRFLNRLKKHLKIPAIPFVTGDTILSNLFPHIYVPHHVWIDSAGKVCFITDGYNATAEHIENFLQGKSINLKEKKFEKDYGFDSPFLAMSNGKWLDKVASYSLLLHCISGVTFPNSATSTTETGNPNRIVQTCASIKQLFTTAYEEGGKYDFSASNSVILEVNNISKYTFPKDYNKWDEYIKNNTYNYEIMVPPSASRELYLKMQEDLQRNFNVKGSIEKRMVRCLVLVKTKACNKLKSKGGKPASNFWIKTDDSMHFIKNKPFKYLVNILNLSAKTKGLSTPFINGTTYTGNIDIKMSTNAIDDFNINALKKDLKNYGLDLVEQTRLLNVLILKEIKEKQE
jgi:thiol-disulfide isomerase/thioredoxin